MLIFSTTVTPHFVKSFLPNLLYEMIVTSIDKNKLDAMDNYLKTIGIEYSTLNIIQYALSNLDIKEVNGVYMIQVSTVLKVGDYTIDQLIRLIDYGNAEVKGISAIKDAINYIESHKAVIIEDYRNRY